MSPFVGREQQLSTLYALLAEVAGEPGPKPGRLLLLRGARRVGKSRLVEEFLDRALAVHAYFTASTRSQPEELRRFAEQIAASTLPNAAAFSGVSPTSWDGALRLLAEALPVDEPSVVVIDDLPQLIAGDPTFEDALHKLFDSEISTRRVLFIAIGSDFAVMEALTEPGRPLHQEATELVVPPIPPSRIASMLHLGAADAIDAYLVTGGLPLALNEWTPGTSLREYLAEAVQSPTSALLVGAERVLAAEFPSQTQAGEVLAAIGSGERTFAAIGRAAGNLHQGSLLRALGTLRDKQVITAAVPLSTARSKETRYQVADPYLYFYLSFLGPHLAEIERGRGDRTLARIEEFWTSWRARAVEPTLRAALGRLLIENRSAEAVIGSYWTRSNTPEIDVVVADRSPIAEIVLAVGAIKWLENAPFDDHDYGELLMHRSQLPGADKQTPVFAVARSGSTVPGLPIYAPEDLLADW